MGRIHIARLPAPRDLLGQIRSELVVLEFLHDVASGFAGRGARRGAVEQIHHAVVGAGVTRAVGGCCSAAGGDGCGLGGAPGGNGELDSVGVRAVDRGEKVIGGVGGRRVCWM